MARAKSNRRTISKKRKPAASHDIIQLILTDHKPLWQLIKVMKSEDATHAKKAAAFEKFTPALLAHAKPEEQTWYMCMKNDYDMSVQGVEGDVEHGLAEQLCNELQKTDDHDMFMAKVKVLAEMVEHHLQEEEEKLLPLFKKQSDPQERRELGMRYVAFKEQRKPARGRGLRLVA
jgi:hemerythrin superfamily protein